MTCDNDAERAIIRAVREHVAHGYGEIRIKIAEGNVDVKEGKSTRFKKSPVDKSNISR